MPVSKPHRRAQLRSAGRHGAIEVPLSSGRILDALSADGRWATEVETSGRIDRMITAAERLDESGAPQKVLKVPRRFMRRAAVALREARVSAWVRDMHGEHEFFVKI